MNISYKCKLPDPDYKRLVLKEHEISDELLVSIYKNLSKLNISDHIEILHNITSEYSERHRNFLELLKKRYLLEICPRLKNRNIISKFGEEGNLLLSAYCSMEYSVEAAALFNPSIVKIQNTDSQYIISMRSTGEGHISSISFLDMTYENNTCIFPARTRFASLPEITMLSENEYRAEFDALIPLSERVLFPTLADEIGGIEDLRMLYHNDDEYYYGTFTAYDKNHIKQKLLQTKDFRVFNICSFRGNAIQDKNFALFPEKINGKYMMLSRQDGTNTYLMSSDDLYTWNDPKIIMKNEYIWEGIKNGNCGSPIRIPEGWLLIMHGVGPIREYCLGIALLDKDEPWKLIARSTHPIMKAIAEEREGYVPNVLYSCGATLVDDTLLLPYASSDLYSYVVSIPIGELISKLVYI